MHPSLREALSQQMLPQAVWQQLSADARHLRVWFAGYGDRRTWGTSFLLTPRVLPFFRQLGGELVDEMGAQHFRTTCPTTAQQLVALRDVWDVFHVCHTSHFARTWSRSGYERAARVLTLGACSRELGGVVREYSERLLELVQQYEYADRSGVTVCDCGSTASTWTVRFVAARGLVRRTYRRNQRLYGPHIARLKR